MQLKLNKQFKKALDVVEGINRSVFITGKAAEK